MNKNDFVRGASSIFRKTIILLSGLILSLVLLEACLRLGGFVPSSIQEYGNLRSAKQKGVYRILCLGESTTAGQYPKLLEQVLNRRNMGVRFSVIDKGKTGINSLIIVNQVDSYLAQYRPDMVVAMMGINDIGITYYQDIPDPESWLFKHCRIYRFGMILYMHLLKRLQNMDIYAPDRADRERKSEPDDKGTAIEKAGLSNKVSAYRMAGSDPKEDKESPEATGSSQQSDNLFDPPKFLEKKISNFRLARLYHAENKFYLAENFYKKVIESDPNNDRAYLELGRLYLERAKFPPAESSFKKAIELNPKNGNAYYGLGVIYRKQGDLSRAEDCFRKAFGIDPQHRRLLGDMSLLYEEMGKPELAKEYSEKARRLLRSGDCAVTADNYRKLKNILDQRGVKLVCAQYPVRNVEPLRRIFEKDEGVIFVDNEWAFKKALRDGNRKEYFCDMFGGDFGHCTPKGNELLAQNIADVILKEIFNK